MNCKALVVPLLLTTGVALAADDPPAQKPEDPKALSGMSILGNQEAPTSLVIVPWKTSELGTALGFSTVLDDSRQPVDKEVFLRALSYYEIRSETTRPESAPRSKS